MADERDLELLDDYLSNRMGGADRSEFEHKMQADPDLQGEYALQKVLVQGIKDARVAELKTMLKNVPVPAAGSGNAFAGKAVVGALTIILAAAAYWFLSNDDGGAGNPAPAADQKLVHEQPIVSPTPPEADRRSEETKTSVKKLKAEPDKNQTSAGTEHSKPSLARRPDPVSPPGKKQDPEPADDTPEDASSLSGTAHQNDYSLRPAESFIDVETIAGNSSYNFHYQFRNDKLVLYGPFGDGNHTVKEYLVNGKPETFLFYDNQYYQIEQNNTDVKPLTPVTDQNLLQALKKYQLK
jgi:hypothetical protein